jgi:hypothetical protein
MPRIIVLEVCDEETSNTEDGVFKKFKEVSDEI